MYIIQDRDKEKILEELLEAIEEENREYKKIISSREYKIGSELLTAVNGFGSVQGIQKFGKRVAGNIRWRKLCKKYPLVHSQEIQNNKKNYFSSEKIVVYTSIFGNYDQVAEPLFCPDNCEFVIITDNEVPGESKWERYDLSRLDNSFNKLTNVQKNRYCKMLPFRLFPEVKYTVYVDGNIQPVSDFTQFINVPMKYGIAFHNHKARNSVYQEADACKTLKKASSDDINELVVYLRDNRFPDKYGMVECNMIVRNNTCETMKKVMQEWWEQFNTHKVKRDQLTLPYVCWKNNIHISDIAVLGENIDDNCAVRFVGHH